MSFKEALLRDYIISARNGHLKYDLLIKNSSRIEKNNILCLFIKKGKGGMQYLSF